MLVDLKTRPHKGMCSVGFRSFVAVYIVFVRIGLTYGSSRVYSVH